MKSQFTLPSHQSTMTATAQEITTHLALTNQLAPVLKRMAFERDALELARSMGLAATDEQVQLAANRFRYRRGLTTARDMDAWLSQHGISLDQFSASMEASLLHQQLKHRLMEKAVNEYFEKNYAILETFRYREIVCDREDLASEILTQIREDGVAFVAAEELHQEQALSVGLRACRFADLPPQLHTSLVTATVGDPLGPIATPIGIHLVMLVGRRAAVLDAPTQHWICNRLIAEWSSNRPPPPSVAVATSPLQTHWN
jgi:parvulin-like peptidyl-prolyl isomerase